MSGVPYCHVQQAWSQQLKHTEHAESGRSLSGKAIDCSRSSGAWERIGVHHEVFLTACIQRTATSSRDIVLPQVELAIDALDFIVDDGWFKPMRRWHCDWVPHVSYGRARRGRHVGSQGLMDNHVRGVRTATQRLSQRQREGDGF